MEITKPVEIHCHIMAPFTSYLRLSIDGLPGGWEQGSREVRNTHPPSRALSAVCVATQAANKAWKRGWETL